MQKLAPTCLKQACVFASCLRAGVSSAVIQENLETWWEDVGKDMFFGDEWSQELEEEFSDEEDDTAPPEKGSPSESKELEVLEHCVEVCEKNALIDQELLQMQEDPKYHGETGETIVNEEQETKDAVPAEPDEQQESSIRTLHDVLESSDLGSFSPGHGDSESKVLMRVRKLIPYMKQLTIFVRSNEGIISKAAVLGGVQKPHLHNEIQFELAKARRTFQCSAERQGRHQVWRSFVEKVVADVQESVEGGECFHAISNLGPSTESFEDGTRYFQLLVVRPFATSADSVGGVRLAIPTAVWRCGKSKKDTSRHEKVVAAGQVPVHVVTKVHVQLLMPTQIATKEDPNTHLVATFLDFVLGYFLIVLTVDGLGWFGFQSWNGMF